TSAVNWRWAKVHRGQTKRSQESRRAGTGQHLHAGAQQGSEVNPSVEVDPPQPVEFSNVLEHVIRVSRSQVNLLDMTEVVMPHVIDQPLRRLGPCRGLASN